MNRAIPTILKIQQDRTWAIFIRNFLQKEINITTNPAKKAQLQPSLDKANEITQALTGHEQSYQIIVNAMRDIIRGRAIGEESDLLSTDDS